MDYVASAVMLKNVKVVPPAMTLPQLEAAFFRDQVSGYAVVDDGKLVGVVTRSDLLRAVAPEHGMTEGECMEETTTRGEGSIPWKSESLRVRTENMDVHDIMTGQVVTVRPKDRLREVADLMYKKRIHRIFVVEEDRLLGIITPFDFVRLYSNERIGADGRPSKTIDF